MTLIFFHTAEQQSSRAVRTSGQYQVCGSAASWYQWHVWVACLPCVVWVASESCGFCWSGWWNQVKNLQETESPAIPWTPSGNTEQNHREWNKEGSHESPLMVGCTKPLPLNVSRLTTQKNWKHIFKFIFPNDHLSCVVWTSECKQMTVGEGEVSPRGRVEERWSEETRTSEEDRTGEQSETFNQTERVLHQTGSSESQFDTGTTNTPCHVPGEVLLLCFCTSTALNLSLSFTF